MFAPLSGGPLYPLAGALFGFNTGFVLLIVGDALGNTIMVVGSSVKKRSSKELRFFV